MRLFQASTERRSTSLRVSRARGRDVFVHISAVEKAGHTMLPEGARVSYELRPVRSGKVSAENLRVG